MRLMRVGREFTIALGIITLAGTCFAQSLGEVARQERARKQSRPPGARILTEEDLKKGETITKPIEAPETASKPAEPKLAAAAKDERPSPTELQAKIRAQKQKVRELEAKIDELQKQLDARSSIGTVTTGQQVIIQPGGMGSGPGLCATSNAMHSNPYKEWCEQPAKMAAEIEKSEVKLKKERAALEFMQEEARRLGYGSAFYDPD
jgi:hypothetical protein